MICSNTRIVLSVCASIFVFTAIVVGCANKSNNSVNGQVGTPTGANTMPVTVNGSLCGPQADQYPNEPCGSVRICVPGTTNCQTISNLLIDTGSSGLRIFSSVVTLPLSGVSAGSGTLAECVGFGDGSSMWGQVAMADVQMGGEPAVTVPVQLVNSTFATPPSACTASSSTPETDPASAGFNGILGVGLFDLDCGAGCSNTASNGFYFSCSGSSCPGVKSSTQVRNPVAALPIDNNGVVMVLPSVDSGGASSLAGALVFGIGTQSNNTPQNVTVFGVSQSGATAGMFNTVFDAFGSSVLSGIIDSGSSLLFIPAVSALPDCNSSAGGSHGSGFAGFYCPSGPQSLNATNMGVPNGSGPVNFQVGNAFDLLASGNSVFSNIGSSSAGNTTFDWGIPFFYGRSVYVGIDDKSSSIGSGAYWAY